MKRITVVSLLLVLLGGLYIEPSSQPAGRLSTAPSIPILMYHKVSPYPTAGGLGLRVPPRNFESQMKLLSELGYQTVNLDDVAAFLRDGKPLPEKPIVITFDDGYRDNFYWARPILLKYCFRATIFLVSDRIGQTNTWDESKGLPRNQLLGIKEIRIMEQEGFQFGSHSKTHPHLTDLDKANAGAEIGGSKAALETALGIPINYFCYPYGRYNGTIVELVKASGYIAALTTAQGQVRKGDNIYTLRRIRITGRTAQNDFLKLLTGTREKL